MSSRWIRISVTTFQIWVLILSLAAFLPAQRKSKSPNVVFSNSTSVTINAAPSVFAPTAAEVYPSQIAVSGMTGTITRVAVTLSGVSHDRVNDLDFLLVGPTGAKYIFLSDGGGGITVDERVWTFADDAATTLPSFTEPFSGSYKPTSGDGSADSFPAPAPAGPYSQPAAATFASVFNGTNPNGNWTLYAVDDFLSSAGSINSGWSMSITTNAAPAVFSNNAYIGVFDSYRTSTPYGTPINVSGLTGAITDINVSLTGFADNNPQWVDVLLVSPNGRGLVLMSDAGSSAPVSNINLTFDDSAANILPQGNITSGTYRPTDYSSTTDFFPSPAPLSPYFASFSGLNSFNGFSPNGEWRLYVVAFGTTSAGAITGGWSVDITTGPIPPLPPAGCSAASFTPTNFGVGVNPTNVAVADYNNDTKPDLAVTNQVSNDVSILLGVGNGTFLPQTLLGAGSGPYAIVAGKFNADNNFDLAVTNSGANTVSIYLGNGNGTFGPPLNLFVGASPLSIASGDLNNDTRADLIVANFGSFFSGSVSVLLGTGSSGSFTAGTSIRTRTQPAFVTTANLNADSNRDVIVANFGSDSVSTFMGTGAGTFFLNQNIQTGAGPVAVEIADLGTDGIADLIVANYNTDSITTCNGNANGSFTGCGNSPAGGANPISIAAADFLNSGTKQFATALSGSNIVKVFTSDVSVGQNPNAVRVADFNNDGKPDIVSANAGSNDVSVMINGCQVAKGNIFDFNGDRRTDFATFRPSRTEWFVSTLNQSGAALRFARPTDTLAPADFDGDRVTDFAVYRPESGLWIIVDRFFRPIYFTQFGLAQDVPVPADYDGDGKADIAVWRPSDGIWYIRQSSDNSLRITPFGSNGDKAAPGDFDGDGKDDLAVYRPSTGVWYIWRSSDSQFTIRQFGITEDKTVVGDYDGDGKADIAVFRPSTSVWYVLKSSDGDFLAVSWGTTGDLPVIGDFEGDGKYDMAIWRNSDRSWWVRKSSDAGLTLFPWGLTGDLPLPNSFVR